MRPRSFGKACSRAAAAVAALGMLACARSSSSALKADHDARVDEIAQIVKEATEQDMLVTLLRNGGGHTMRSSSYKRGTCRVDLRNMTAILSVNEVEGEASSATALVEPSVTMEQLVRHLAPLKLAPCVVPEFRHMTVGGAIQGLAAESGSHRHGFFHDTAVMYEVVTGAGQVLNLTADGPHANLFHGIPGSYGSLALITAAELRLCPVKEYVVLSFDLYDSSEAMVASLAASMNSMDFQEGIGYTPNKFVHVLGTFCNEGDDCPAPDVAPRKRFDALMSPWFYRAAEKLAGSRIVIKSEDYYFRHDRGAFWMASYRIPAPVGRLLGGLLSSRRMFRMSKLLPFAFPRRSIVLQDFMLPVNATASFVDELHDKLQLWPLWFLPMKNKEEPTLMSVPQSGGDYCNVGAYGIPRKAYSYIQDNIGLERALVERGGRKVFYSTSYFTKDELLGPGGLYDGSAYKALRRTYGGKDAFPSFTDKVITQGLELG